MSDNLPQFLGQAEFTEFDPELFYWEKIVPFRETFQSSHKYSPTMVSGFLSDEVEDEIVDIGRVRQILTGSRSQSRKADYSELVLGLEDNIESYDEEFSTWYEELCSNLPIFSESRDFRIYSISNSPPAETSKVYEPVKTISESAVEHFSQDKISVLGSNHYVMSVDQEKFSEEYGMPPSRLVDQGYLGREGTKHNMRIFINDNLVKKIVSTDLGSNPYTP